jgi:ABC-type branched-subunit amino acid transport system ATPase component
VGLSVHAELRVVFLIKFKQSLYFLLPYIQKSPPLGNIYLLKCMEVSKTFGGLQAVKKVDLIVNPDQISGLVGPNGSGKSTLLNLISGVYKPDDGKILFENQDITKLPPYAICSMGIAKTSQTVQSFPDMTMLENVLDCLKRNSVFWQRISMS